MLFAESLEQSALREQPQVTRDARLALAEQLRQFGHRELAQRQHGQQPQAARVGRRLQAVQQLVVAELHAIRI